MRKADILIGQVYFDGNRSYRLVYDKAKPLFSNQVDTDNLAYVLIQVRVDGKGLSGSGKGRKLSCTRTSIAGWAKQHVPWDDLPQQVRAAFRGALASREPGREGV